MLAHSFDRFYVVTKFILPTLDDLKLSPIKYNKECRYIQDLDDQENKEIEQNKRDLLLCCSKLRPYMELYKMQMKALNSTTHHILKKEVDLIFGKILQRSEKKEGNF